MDIMEMLQVVLMGIGTVFVCLVSLILLTKIMSAIIRSFNTKSTANTSNVTAPTPKTAVTIPTPPTTVKVIPNKPQFVAAVGSAIATYMGTDVSNIRIHSIKPKGSSVTISSQTPDKQQFVAAVGSAIATHIGTDVSNIRIHSIKKI